MGLFHYQNLMGTFTKQNDGNDSLEALVVVARRTTKRCYNDMA